MNFFEHYVDHGFSVVPIKLDATKAPAIHSWRGYMERYPNAAACREWDGQGYGVGLVCGKISGGLEVIDIDSPDLVSEWMEALWKTDPNLADKICFIGTPRVDEQGKHGCHVAYRCSTPVGNQKLAMSEPHPEVDDEGNPIIDKFTGKVRVKPDTLIETRGEGGYVLTIGSPAACHPSGNTYEHSWKLELHELLPITDDERNALLRISKSFDRSVAKQHVDTKYEEVSDSPGNIYARTVSWEEILVPHGWKQVHAEGPKGYWCRPGKDRGTSATTGLLSKHGNDLLCVFSSNAHPFAGPSVTGNCSTHTKFDAFTQLNFDGDYSAAAKKIRLDYGMGEEPPPEKHAKPTMCPTLSSCMSEYSQHIRNGGDDMISCGLGELDEALAGGFEYGEFVIIGGRPSHGKSLLTFQMLNEIAKAEISSLLLSEEMSKRLVVKRFLMQEGASFETTELTLDAASKHYPSFDRISIAQAHTVGNAEKLIRESHGEQGVRVFALDYLQLLRCEGTSRYEQVTEASQKLSELTTELDIILIAACQLGRQTDTSNPDLANLKGSGQLEQDADVALFVEWPAMGGANVNRDAYAIHIRKNRNRETRATSLDMRIDPSRQLILPPNYEWPANP